MTDKLIRAIAHEAFDPLQFRSRVSCLRDLRKSEDNLVRKSLTNMIFRETRVRDPEDGQAHGIAWLRGPVAVLKSQMLRCDAKTVWYNTMQEVNRAGERVWGHPMGYDLVAEASPLIALEVMCNNEEATWTEGVSFVGACQIYTDKTCTTLKASS